MESRKFVSMAWPFSRAVIVSLGDDASTAHQIQQDLAETGSRLIFCRTGKGARKILERWPVDVLLIQCQSRMLPDIAPFQLLRRTYPDQTFSILLITHSTDQDLLTAAYEAGIDDFITTPYDRLRFLTHMRTAVHRAILDRELKEKNENLSVAVTSYEGAFKQVGALAHELQEKNRQLEELSRLKDEMVDIVAHDLRNPISTIEMYTDYLIEELPDLAEEPTSFLLNTKAIVSEVLTMVGELLDLSNFETGKIEICPGIVELRPFLGPIIERMNLLFKQKGVRFDLDVDEAPEAWMIDKKRIAQVLENLLTNAAKFSERDSGVMVRVDKEDNFLRIAVEDKGQGIPECEMRTVFRKFHKGSAKPTAGESSTGLGLAIAKQIVEQHQGKIVVKSTEGEGSTFTILLPPDSQSSNDTKETLQVAYATS